MSLIHISSSPTASPTACAKHAKTRRPAQSARTSPPHRGAGTFHGQRRRLKTCLLYTYPHHPLPVPPPAPTTPKHAAPPNPLEHHLRTEGRGLFMAKGED